MFTFILLILSYLIGLALSQKSKSIAKKELTSKIKLETSYIEKIKKMEEKIHYLENK